MSGGSAFESHLVHHPKNDLLAYLQFLLAYLLTYSFYLLSYLLTYSNYFLTYLQYLLNYHVLFTSLVNQFGIQVKFKSEVSKSSSDLLYFRYTVERLDPL